MLVLKSISKAFTVAQKKKAIIDQLNLTVPSGTVLGVLGPNGAGKSTTIKMIMDFIRPDSGEVLICGKSHRDPQSRKKVGFLPEHPYYYDNLTSWELLTFIGKTSGMSRDTIRQRGNILLEKLQLIHAANDLLRTYSKGMQQRVGFAACLLHEPDLLILDEPLSGLDPIGRHLIISLLEELKNEQKTIFFSSHILNDIERICDSVAILNHGRLLFCDKLSQCTQNGTITLEDFFISMIQSDTKL
jgi:ABC-2 type transport system ATP-binding protein